MSPTTSPVARFETTSPDHGRARVVDQDDLRGVRADLGDPSDERAALADDDVADGEPVRPCPGRSSRSGSRRRRRGRSRAPRPSCTGTSPGSGAATESCSFSGARAWRRRFSAVEALVLGLERPVVAPQLVDLRDRADDRPNLDADPVDGILGGSQGEREAPLELLGDGRGAGRHEHRAEIASRIPYATRRRRTTRGARCP